MSVLRLLTLVTLACFILAGCGTDDNPVTSEPVQSDLSVLVTVQPIPTLRVSETWTYWTTPVQVPFVAAVTGDGGTSGSGGDHAHKIVAVNAAGEDVLVGSADVSGMNISVKIAQGMNMYELEHGGEMHEHHAEPGDHHVVVEIAETATGHHAHGDAVVPHAQITIIAVSESSGDTTEIELTGVQSEHGFRYESNAALTYDTYDLHVEVEPPTFLRHESTQTNWTEHAEFEFHGWVFDSGTSGTIGSGFWAGPANDSLELSLRAGAVKTYGAVGIGSLPLEGDETVNFSVKLSAPGVAAHAQPLFEAVVTVSVHNSATNETMSSLVRPMWDEHGFHFAQNMPLNLGHITGGSSQTGGGHGH